MRANHVTAALLAAASLLTLSSAARAQAPSSSAGDAAGAAAAPTAATQHVVGNEAAGSDATSRPPAGSASGSCDCVEGRRLGSAQLAADAAALTRAVALDAEQRALAEVAESRGSSSRIQALGVRVRNDADEADQALRRVARRLQLASPPSQLTPDQSAHVAELKKEPRGPDLDRRLVDAILAAQREEELLLDRLRGRPADDGARPLVERAARSVREADRAASIERKSM